LLEGYRYSETPSGSDSLNAQLQYNYLIKLLQQPESDAIKAKIRSTLTDILPILINTHYSLSVRFSSDLLHSKFNVAKHVGAELTDALLVKVLGSQLDPKALTAVTFAILKQRQKYYSKSSFHLAANKSPADIQLLTVMRNYLADRDFPVGDLVDTINNWFSLKSVPPMVWVNLETLNFISTPDLAKISDEQMRQLLNEFEVRNYTEVAPVLLKFKDHKYFLSDSFVFHHRKFVSLMFWSYIHGSAETYNFLKHLKSLNLEPSRQPSVLTEFASLALKRTHSQHAENFEHMMSHLNLGAKARELLAGAVRDAKKTIKSQVDEFAPRDSGANELARKFCEVYLRRLSGH
jgi:hypothetical protein